MAALLQIQYEIPTADIEQVFEVLSQIEIHTADVEEVIEVVSESEEDMVDVTQVLDEEVLAKNLPAEKLPTNQCLVSNLPEGFEEVFQDSTQGI